MKEDERTPLISTRVVGFAATKKEKDIVLLYSIVLLSPQVFKRISLLFNLENTSSH